MRSIDIANIFLQRYGNKLFLTNLTLNKLVYFAQVEALKLDPSRPLFTDEIQAWEFGPVEPVLYHALKIYGRNRIRMPVAPVTLNKDEQGFAERIVDSVVSQYGSITPFDLVRLTHKENGAWNNKYVKGENATITVEDILASNDTNASSDCEKSFGAALQSVQIKWPNAIRMLEDA